MSHGTSNLSSFNILVTYSEVMDSMMPIQARVAVITEEQDILSLKIQKKTCRFNMTIIFLF